MLLVIILIIAVSYLVIYLVHSKSLPKDYISFGESLALTELPIITFYQGEHKINCVLDTGANISVLDLEAAKPLEIEPTDKFSECTGVSGISQKAFIVSVSFNYKDRLFTEEFQVLDMSDTFSKIKKATGVTVHGMIGNAFMQKYKYVLDFKEMIAYSRK